jgi:predicted histone-like DNA-binding protein
MSKILYEVYQNDIKDSESVMFGKWYARLKSIETLSTEKLAKHISEHGSVFTADVVEGVMKKVKTCLVEMLLESKKVKIAGLGTFYLTAECTKGGADKEEDFNVNQHLAALHIRFLPDQAAEDNLSSREFIKKAEFVNVKSLISSGKEESEGTQEGENGGSQNGGSQNGSGNGSGNGSESGNGGSQSQQGEQNQPQGYALQIVTSGSGTATVTHDGNAVTSGATLSEDDEVEIAITPAEGQVPTATINGSNIELTEDNGVYTGSFAMPGQASALVISTGVSGDGGDGGEGLDKD